MGGGYESASGDEGNHRNNSPYRSDEEKKAGSSKRKQRSRTRSRSRSRSRSRTPVRRRQRSHSRSRSRSASPPEGYRVHIGEIDGSINERDIEDAMSKYGPVNEIWIATYAPYFAFANFKTKEDAEDAVRFLNGTYLRNCRIRVSLALPRRRYGGGGGPRDRRPPMGNRYGGGGGGYDRRGYGGGGYGGYGGYGGGYGGGRGGGGGGRSSHYRRSPSYERRSRSRD